MNCIPPLPIRSFDVTRSLQSRFLEKIKKIRTRSAPRQPSIAIAAGHKCGERAYISQNNTTHESFEHGQPRILVIPTEPFGTHSWLLEVRKIPAHYVSFLTLYCPHRPPAWAPGGDQSSIEISDHFTIMYTLSNISSWIFNEFWITYSWNFMFMFTYRFWNA